MVDKIISFLLSVICGHKDHTVIIYTAKDGEQVWLTSRNKHHFLVDVRTGEIKNGFAGAIQNINDPENNWVSTNNDNNRIVTKQGVICHEISPYVQNMLKTVNGVTYNKDTQELTQNKQRILLNSPEAKIMLKLLNVSQINAVLDFTANDMFQQIRAAQRGEKKKTYFREAARQIELAIRYLPRWSNVRPLFRGITMYSDELAQYKVGDDFPLRGVSSWSTSNIIAHEFADGKYGPKKDYSVVFSIEKPPKICADIKYLSPRFERQDEVAVSSVTKVRIKGITRGRNKRQIFIELEEYD